MNPFTDVRNRMEAIERKVEQIIKLVMNKDAQANRNVRSLQYPQPLLDEISRQGLDPLRSESEKSFHNFFRRANRYRLDFDLEPLAHEILQPEIFRATGGQEWVGSIITRPFRTSRGERNDKEIQLAMHMYRRKERKLQVTKLRMYCFTFSYSAKLRQKAVFALTDLQPRHLSLLNTLKWCAADRTWKWTWVEFTNYDQLPPLPSMCSIVFFGSLAASMFAKLPLQCPRCLHWIKDYCLWQSHVDSCVGTGPLPQDNIIDINFDLSSWQDNFQFLICESCMLAFCSPLCLALHQRFHPEMFHHISPLASLFPLHQSWLSTLLVERTPFRKLRTGCFHCAQSFFKQNNHKEEIERAKSKRLQLKWVYFVLSLYLQKLVQHSNYLQAAKNLRNKSLRNSKPLLHFWLSYL